MRIEKKLISGVLLSCLSLTSHSAADCDKHDDVKKIAVAYMGNPILYKRTEDVKDLHSSEVMQMSVKLKDTLTELQATGFAAPQLQSPLRMMVISVSRERAKKFGYDKE